MPSKFSESVHIVNNYFSTFQHSQRLRGHTIFENIKINVLLLLMLLFYFVSAQSLTTLTQCLHSQQLCLHVFALSLTTLTQCPRSQEVRRHGVNIINDHADIVSVQLTTTWTHVFREYLREHEIFRENVFACSYGAQVEFLIEKGSKISRHCHFRIE